MERRLFIPIPLMTTLLVFFFLAESGFTQIPSIKAKQERKRSSPLAYRRDLPLSSPTPRAAPPGPVHSCAEWEESEGVMCLWWNADLMDKLQLDNKVYIPVDNQEEKDDWIQFLTSNGIPLTNFEFLFIHAPSIYVRDEGPWFIWDANNDMGIVDAYTLTFNQNFASWFGINYYHSGLMCEGGNYYPNAYGTAFATTGVYTWNRNNTKEETDQTMYDFCGIENYHTVVTDPWGLEHHDTYGKPSNPETLIIGRWTEVDTPSYAYCEGMAAHYETLESPWGRPYKIFRMPIIGPYLNALVSNKKVFVPITGKPNDKIALDLFQKAFPGYEIVGVDSMSTPWKNSLHCRTRNFMKRDALRIYPYPPRDTENTVSDYPVTTEAIPPKGFKLLAGYPKLCWTGTGGAPFQEIVMAPTGQPNEYAAEIPAKPLDTTISFYIEAKDDGGRSAVYPPVAPDGLMSFQVREDRSAPVISRFIPTRGAVSGPWHPNIRTLCKDDMYTPQLRVEWELNGVPQPDITLNRESLCYWYSGELGGNADAGDLATYRVLAKDSAFSPNGDALPKVGKVYLPVSGQNESVAVVDLSRRPHTAPFIADTLGDLGIPYTYYTSWPADFSQHGIWFFCLGVFADNYILGTEEARDIVVALDAGDFIYMESGDGWCYDPMKLTLRPWFGVQGIKDGGYLDEGVLIGQPGTIVDGLELVYAGVNALMDEIEAVSPAEVIFRSKYNAGCTVLNDAGTYRTIASNFMLGGLLDETWPETRKEILLRFLEFFGVERGALLATTEARLETRIMIRLEGDAGDGYLLLASLAENYLPMSGYGTFRLDPGYMFHLSQGVFPPSGLVEGILQIPPDEEYLGYEIHLQAAVGSEFKPGKAHFTNREILTIVE